jgi:molecular chaperone GrpE
MDSTKEYAITKFAKDVLEIKDNLEKSLEAVKLEDLEKMELAALKESFKTFHEGIVMTGQVMESVMKKFGIVKYNPMNEKFDPNMHEAFLKVEDQTKPENTICTVMQTGYKINKRILRAPKVAVTKKPKS